MVFRQLKHGRQQRLIERHPRIPVDTVGSEERKLIGAPELISSAVPTARIEREVPCFAWLVALHDQ